MKPEHNKIDNLCDTLELKIRHTDDKIIDRFVLDVLKEAYYEHQAMLRCGEYPAITVFRDDEVFMRYVYVDKCKYVEKCKDLFLPF